MSSYISQIAEAFCSYRFAEIFPYIHDEIKWNIVGREELVDRDAVIDRCGKSAKLLETVPATITKLKIHRAATCGVVEGAAQIQDQAHQTSSVASCDVFQFSDERLVVITSCIIDAEQIIALFQTFDGLNFNKVRFLRQGVLYNLTTLTNASTDGGYAARF